MITIRPPSNMLKVEENRIFDIELSKTSKGELNMGIVETVKEIFKEQGKLEGALETEEERNTEFVTKLIIKLGLSDDQAADVATVSIDFVQKVRASLAKKQKI
ncbi:hypothetical protein SAMN05216436_11165 [bacterium A37T11]|nr:hypothetical protein SAMN05216436_11165 [bacterium A37T11]